jgi:hypothetical protein
MTVHTQPDYQIRASGPAPENYPATALADAFSDHPFQPEYAARRSAFFKHILQNPAPANTKPAWHELARLAAGGTAHAGIFFAALDFIDQRKDCSDFVLHSFLRLTYMLDENQRQKLLKKGVPEISQSRINPGLPERIRQTILNFKYFPNEPGIDSLCTWTENHYILYSSAGYLAGQLYPDGIFSNSGETGKHKQEINRTRILRWLDLRFHSGFSEWLSHVYYDEDLTALLALYDFAWDEEIQRKAEMVLDLLLFDMALNSFKGVFGSTHGRAYENTKKWASNEGTTDTTKLLFGTGIFSGFDNMSATAFALSGYCLPEVIESIANYKSAENDPAMENRQRMGIQLNEMEKWGIHPDTFEDGMHTLTLEAYLHPRTIENTLRMFDTCNWWENSFLSDFKPYRQLLRMLGRLGGLPWLARLLKRDLCRNTREEVNLYTYKTADYMLSTAQDYRKGYGGDQQHIWQATLGNEAVCFTTHPAKLEGVTPNYWEGNGLLPRAAQYKNVVVVVYNIEKILALYVPIRHYFTHAWLPKDKFEDVVERNGWIFARKGQGYLGLRSQKPYFWNTDSNEFRLPIEYRRNREDINRELIADGAQNIWICQMGCQAQDGDFAEFVTTISTAELGFKGRNVEYRSPGNGLIQFGWEGPLLVDRVEFPLRDYGRYENPFAKVEFNSNSIQIANADHKLRLNWEALERMEY